MCCRLPDGRPAGVIQASDAVDGTPPRGSGWRAGRAGGRILQCRYARISSSGSTSAAPTQQRHSARASAAPTPLSAAPTQRQRQHQRQRQRQYRWQLLVEGSRHHQVYRKGARQQAFSGPGALGPAPLTSHAVGLGPAACQLQTHMPSRGLAQAAQGPRPCVCLQSCWVRPPWSGMKHSQDAEAAAVPAATAVPAAVAVAVAARVHGLPAVSEQERKLTSGGCSSLVCITSLSTLGHPSTCMAGHE